MAILITKPSQLENIEVVVACPIASDSVPLTHSAG